jgi:hypothetical protein
VDADRPAALDAPALGEPDVIRVAVRQHDRPDVVERPSHGGELDRNRAPVARHAGIDDRHLA